MSKNAIWITGTLVALVLGLAMAFMGSDNGVRVEGLALFAGCIALSFIIQWCAFVPAYGFSTEKFYDLIGSVTYITLVVIALVFMPESSPRDYLFGALVLIWATRLGQFLFRRVLSAGEDRRFREMKTDFLQFFMTWTLQGLWVAITLSAALAAMTASEKMPLDYWALVGGLVWVVGFAIEVVADAQKTQFRQDPANRDQFIQSGLWAWSRHPNYFGEILLWFGIALIAYPVLQGLQHFALISPIFVFVLMNYVSGVRMLEARADRKWGREEAYQAYKARTPSLLMKKPT